MGEGKDEVADGVGARVKRYREAAGMSTTELASLVGLSERAVTKLEDGDSKAPNFLNALFYAAALGVEPIRLALGDNWASNPRVARLLRQGKRFESFTPLADDEVETAEHLAEDPGRPVRQQLAARGARLATRVRRLEERLQSLEASNNTIAESAKTRKHQGQ